MKQKRLVLICSCSIFQWSDQSLNITIREIYEGGSPMSSDMARKMIRVLQLKNTKPDYGITRKEGEMLTLLSKGHTCQEVADQLFISIKDTEKSYLPYV